MYLPQDENFTSDIEDIISEKNDFVVESSGSSNTEKKQSILYFLFGVTLNFFICLVLILKRTEISDFWQGGGSLLHY